MHAMAEQRTDFTDLLKTRRAELGLSLREMEMRSVDPESGERAKFGWLSKVERGESVDPPKEERLRAIAAGYGLPLKELQRAAARQFFGYDPAADSQVWSEDLTTRLIVARAEEMTEEERRQFAEIAETFARRRTERDGKARGKSDD